MLCACEECGVLKVWVMRSRRWYFYREAASVEDARLLALEAWKDWPLAEAVKVTQDWRVLSEERKKRHGSN